MSQPDNVPNIDRDCPYCNGEGRHSKSRRKDCKKSKARFGGKKKKKK